MLPTSIQKQFIQWLTVSYGNEGRITGVQPISGGSVNYAFHIQTTEGEFFLKYNRTSKYPGMFSAEAKGLALLKNSGKIKIPKVLLQESLDDFSFLLLEYIDAVEQVNNFWDDFGRKLAELHANTSAKFGLEHDNYIGSLPQKNTSSPSWTSFLIENRFVPLIKMAKDKKLLTITDSASFERMFRRLDEIIPEEKPALLHGDLWSGNFLTDAKGEACIIDPAVYYGHREIDLAMTKLFGGFASPFYTSYNEAMPLEKGWESRISINQLYPLLVHVNLFGNSYTGQVRQIIKKF